MKEENRRQHFRLHYEIGNRPKLIVGRNEFEVLDISERGLRFLADETKTFALNAKFRGVVVFKDEKNFLVEGQVRRIVEEGTQVAVMLTQGIPLSKMMEEHLRQLKRKAG